MVFVYFASWFCLIRVRSVGRKKGADKRAEAAKKELAELRAALESKEKELQAQNGELERLRQVEEQFLQAEKAECGCL